jgi:hypothetical protein
MTREDKHALFAAAALNALLVIDRARPLGEQDEIKCIVIDAAWIADQMADEVERIAARITQLEAEVGRLVALLDGEIVAWRNVNRPMMAQNLANDLYLARHPDAKSTTEENS